MDRLCDEVLQLIFYELNDPGPLAHASKRLHNFSQDPYVRAHYFLARYGEAEAMYHALGRGKIITERVLDILLTSSAHLSRYLIQIAIHHYFHTQAHFIKTPWVRHMSLRVFTYFMKLAEGMYGEIPHGKGEDDGSVFTCFLKESRFPPQVKSVSWETIREILEKYKFIPFSMKDPVMAQFPLALAVEPRLLPYASANGFKMDSKYRDFVFRKMFERPSIASEINAEDIARNVRELCKLDPTMFVTRTVAAEVCMEAKVNESGYTALKQLDNSGQLRFELSTLVEDLLKTFLTTRSICNAITGEVLRHLYTDFPSSDPAVRLVILIVVFIAAENQHHSPSLIQSRLEALGVVPLSKKDLYNVLINPFVERYSMLLDYARQEVGVKENGTKGMGHAEIKELVEEVCAKCLEIACKGKLLKKLYDGYPSVHYSVMKLVLEKYQVSLSDIPSWEDGPAAIRSYGVDLCRDFMLYGVGEVHTSESLISAGDSEKKLVGRDRKEGIDSEGKEISAIRAMSPEVNAVVEERVGDAAEMELGGITQETLTTMIRHDEVAPTRSRRRIYYHGGYGDSAGKLHYPHDPLHVGRWAKSQFGVRSSVTAIFMTHAVINDNCSMLHHYLLYADGNLVNLPSTHVPVTFKHFQILARLGRAPHFYIYHDIEQGAEFYLDEFDYIPKTDPARNLLRKSKVKIESPSPSSSTPKTGAPTSPSSSIPRGKKRPRRSVAASVRSYVIPDSDDEEIADEEDLSYSGESEKKQIIKESSLQLWIKHLGELLKEEERKFKERKKLLEREAEPGTKLRVNKSEFLKSLVPNLRNLRKIEAEKRIKYFGSEDFAEGYSDADDDDYTIRRTKKRRTAYVS